MRAVLGTGLGGCTSPRSRSQQGSAPCTALCMFIDPIAAACITACCKFCAIMNLGVGLESKMCRQAAAVMGFSGLHVETTDRRGTIAVHIHVDAMYMFMFMLVQVVLERACKAAAERADNDFRQLLLSQQQEGAIAHTSTWAAVKAQVRLTSSPAVLTLALLCSTTAPWACFSCRNILSCRNTQL